MVAKHLSKYLTNDKYKHIKLLSIIDKKTLGHQHLKSFDDYKIDVLSYQNGFKKNNHFCICINSLLQLDKLSNMELSQYFFLLMKLTVFYN